MFTLQCFHLPKSLRGQFALAGLALSLLIAAAGLIAFFALRNTAGTFRELAEERLEYLQNAQDLMQSALLIERETYRLQTVDSVEGIRKSYSEIIDLLTSLDVMVVRLGHADDGMTMVPLHHAGQLFRNSVNIVVRLRLNALDSDFTDGNQEQLQRFQKQLEQQVVALTSAARALSVHLTDDYRVKVKQLADTSRRGSWEVLALVFGCWYLTWLVFRYFLGRHVVRRLGVVSQYLRIGEVEAGRVTVPVLGFDEIAGMARAVEQFLEDRRQLVATQHSLRQSEEMLRAVTDAVQSAVFLFDDEGRIQFANPAVEVMLGYTRDEMVGCRLNETFVPEFPPQSVHEGLALCRCPREEPAMMKPQELVVKHKSGKTRTILFQVGCILRSEKWWAVGSAIDITERLAIAAELKKTQSEAMHAARMSSIGQLAGGIAHEINTPAQYVSDNLRFMDDAVGAIVPVLSAAQNLAAETMDRESAVLLVDAYEQADVSFLMEEMPKAIRQSLEGMGKVTQLVHSMKNFSHSEGPAKQMADVRNAIKDVINITRNIWKSVATIETYFAADLPSLYCSIGEINQVILNLIINAAQAIAEADKPGLGKILIEAKAVGTDLCIAVTDSGYGISEDIREFIFDPFFTTKEVGKGVGQGLAICYDIVVNKHGGRIEVGGEPGQGAVLTVFLPIQMV